MPANAELTANGHSSMTSSSLALAAVLMDESTGAGANGESLGIELLQRATRDGYDRWLNTALAAGGCVRPVRLRGTVRDVDTTTGEILHGLDTEDLPDKAMYVPCGDRRASVCPPCAETYRADTYQLIRAGLAGGKGIPESLAAHPCVFATFTAPSFGPVHTRVVGRGGTVARCRPRRKASFCPHGHVMEQAVRDGIMDRNPARIIGWQRDYQRAEDELDDPRSLALPDWQALCDLAAALVARSADHFEGWGDVVIFAACTAARIGEVSGIRCADIERDAWTWTVRRQTTPSPGGLIDKGTKGKRARTVPLIEEVRPLIERRLNSVGHDPAARVFTGPRGGRITTAVLRDATHWDEVVTRLGYEHLRRHDLRHTGLTWLADAGVPVHVLRKIAGHGSLVTTQRYLHPGTQSIADAGTALSAHLAVEKGSQSPQWSPNGPQLRLIEGDKA